MDQTLSSNVCKNYKKAKKNINAIHLLPEVNGQYVKHYINDLSRRYYVKKSEFLFNCLLCVSTMDSWSDFFEHLKNPSHLEQIKEEKINFTAICVICKYIFMTKDVNSVVKHFFCHQENPSRTNSMTAGNIHQTAPMKDKKICMNLFEGNDSSNPPLDSIKTKLAQPEVDEKHNESGQHIVFRTEIVGEQKSNISLPLSYNSVLEADLLIANHTSNCCSNLEGQSRNNCNDSLSSMGLLSNGKFCSLAKTVTPDCTGLEKKSYYIKKLINPNNSYQYKKYPDIATDNTNVAYPSVRFGVCQLTEPSGSFQPSSHQNKYYETETGELFYENRDISDKCKEEITFYPKEAKFSESAFQLIDPGVRYNFTITLDFNAKNIKEYIAKTYYSVYHFLRKLYFSCLLCNSRRMPEEEFYLHLKGKKHKLKIKKYGEITYYVKICDICQLFLFGTIDLVKDHFNSDRHLLNMKCKLDLIEQQHAINSGNSKLGWSGKLTSNCIEMFSSKQSLNSWIESSLEDADMVLSMAHSVNKIIENDISKVLKEQYCNFEIEFVGSRAYGLAKHQSDADIYLKIGDVSIEDLEKHFSKAVDLFKVKKTIKNAKVPIIRLEHKSSNITCDINCSNPIGPYGSELIKTYISLDPRIRWMVMAVREWAAANNIRGTRKFTSYGLTWLVLFFLMSPPIYLIPPVKILKSLYKGPKVIINGWNSSFTTDIEEIKKNHDPLSCSLSKYELLGQFFRHHSIVNLKKLVLFPHEGVAYSRPFFANPHVLIHPLLHYNPENQDPLKVGGQIMIMDSLRLRENILKSVDENLADHFKLICEETLKSGWWN